MLNFQAQRHLYQTMEVNSQVWIQQKRYMQVPSRRGSEGSLQQDLQVPSGSVPTRIASIGAYKNGYLVDGTFRYLIEGMYRYLKIARLDSIPSLPISVMTSLHTVPLPLSSFIACFEMQFFQVCCPPQSFMEGCHLKICHFGMMSLKEMSEQENFHQNVPTKYDQTITKVPRGQFVKLDKLFNFIYFYDSFFVCCKPLDFWLDGGCPNDTFLYHLWRIILPKMFR